MKNFYCELREKGSDTLLQAIAEAPDGPAAVERIKNRVREEREINQIPRMEEATFDAEVLRVEEVNGVLILNWLKKK